MGPNIIELRPDYKLLNPNFDGYKLSLKSIPSAKKTLSTSVYRILLDPRRFSLLHVKLFGLHNHLYGETVNETESVYFVDEEWNLCKTYVDTCVFEMCDPIKVWKIPKPEEQKSRYYNITLKFVNESLLVLTDGMGMLYLLNTGDRNVDNLFTLIHSELIEICNEGFIIKDAKHITSDQKEQLHILITHVKQSETKDHYITVVNWISLTKLVDGWGQSALREIHIKGDIQYISLDKCCEAIYLVSDGKSTFKLNSEYPVDVLSNVTYNWSQTDTTVNVKVTLPENIDKTKLTVTSHFNNLTVKYEDTVLLNEMLQKAVESDSTNWNVENNELNIVLKKVDNLMWTSLTGENKNTDIFEAEFKMNEEYNDRGNIYNSQQIEDCDLEYDKIVKFEKICGKTNRTVAKSNMGSNPVLLTINMEHDCPPALGLRHDVDILMWQINQNENSDFEIKHKGTLHAFGYIQASKQQKKFMVCSPDLNSVVICQDTRHIFLYKQQSTIDSGELRNRNTGRYIPKMAQQYVINIDNEEIIGVYCSNKFLFILGNLYISVFNIA